MPSQGEGEQSTKFGGPCPNWFQPPLRCRFENEFPPFCPPGVVGAGVIGLLETVICNGCCLDTPLESETEMAKLKLPLALGVPEMVPELSLRSTPWGSAPEAIEKA
jgi:hypothetical protein